MRRFFVIATLMHLFGCSAETLGVPQFEFADSGMDNVDAGTTSTTSIDAGDAGVFDAQLVDAGNVIDGSVETDACASFAAPGIEPRVAMTPAASGAFPMGGFVDDAGRVTVFGVGFRSGDPGDFIFVSRLAPDGSADPAYGSGGIARYFPADYGAGFGAAAAPGPDGVTYFLAGIRLEQGVHNVNIHRFDNSGALDSSFGVAGAAPVFEDPGTINSLEDVAIGTDGQFLYVMARVYLLTTPLPPIGGPALIIRRFNMAGARDQSFEFVGDVSTRVMGRSQDAAVAFGNGTTVWRVARSVFDTIELGGYRDYALRRDHSMLVVQGTSLASYTAGGIESLLSVPFDGPVAFRRVDERCDARPMLFVEHTMNPAVALLTAAGELDPSRGSGGYVSQVLHDDTIGDVVPVFDRARGRVTFVAHSRDETLFAYPVLP